MENKNEIWKDICGYEGLYQVSNFGRIKSVDRIIKNTGTKSGEYHVKEKIKKISEYKSRGGYCGVTLYRNNNGKSYRVHRLVAQAFIPNPENKPEINHIDGNKKNNCVDNLEWVTGEENTLHAWDIGLVDNTFGTAVHCNETGVDYKSVVDASRDTGCPKESIFRVLRGEYRHTHGLTFSRI